MSNYSVMSPAQLALAAGADPKWIQNVRRLLGRKSGSEPEDARWFGNVRALHATLGCSLATAGRIADLVVEAPIEQRELHLPLDTAGAFTLTIDLHRSWTLHVARLSRAIVMPAPERRGRRPRTSRAGATKRAIVYGIDVERLRSGLVRGVAERLATLDDNAALLAAGQSSLARRRGRR
jgi:hypothetical protein